MTRIILMTLFLMTSAHAAICGKILGYSKDSVQVKFLAPDGRTMTAPFVVKSNSDTLGLEDVKMAMTHDWTVCFDDGPSFNTFYVTEIKK